MTIDLMFESKFYFHQAIEVLKSKSKKVLKLDQLANYGASKLEITSLLSSASLDLS